MERNRDRGKGISKRSLKGSYCLGSKRGSGKINCGRAVKKKKKERKGLGWDWKGGREKSRGWHKMERRFKKTSHLLVLRFLHSLVDVIEDLSTAVRCLLDFVLLHCVVWNILWHQIRRKASLVLQEGCPANWYFLCPLTRHYSLKLW